MAGSGHSRIKAQLSMKAAIVCAHSTACLYLTAALVAAGAEPDLQHKALRMPQHSDDGACKAMLAFLQAVVLRLGSCWDGTVLRLLSRLTRATAPCIECCLRHRLQGEHGTCNQHLNCDCPPSSAPTESVPCSVCHKTMPTAWY